jgi:(heptosyl)LPS beta-1,4-glucosyltransferase
VETISVVLNVVEYEVDLLPRALSSVKGFADEIILVDMTSSEELSNIAKKFNAKVYKHDFAAYVEIARNFGISKSSGDWILIMDPDEEINSSLRKKIKEIVGNPTADYYRLPRKNIIFDKWIKHSRFWPDYNIRFFRKGKVTWSEIIHSVPETVGVGADLSAEEDNAITHYHYESIEQFVTRLNRYTSEHAKLHVKDGYKFKWSDLIEKPVNEFLSRYFQGEGYKDGLHGLALAGLQAFSEFVLYLKIWQSDKFKEVQLDSEEVVSEMREAESNLHYWQSDTLFKEVGGLKYRIKRKLKL